MSFLYAVLSSFMCGTCLLVIGSANPIHAILLLIRVFFRGTILLFCLQIEYYAILFLIVYVGAIVVLFLFIIIRLELKRVNVATRLGDLFSFRHLIFLCLVFQRFLFISNQFFDLNGFFIQQTSMRAFSLNIYSLLPAVLMIITSLIFVFHKYIPYLNSGYAMLEKDIERRSGFTFWIVYCCIRLVLFMMFRAISISFEVASPIMSNSYLIESNQYMNWSQLIYRTDQLRALGAILYTEYRVSVILASLLLFVSRVGALAVTLFFPKTKFSVEEINSRKRQDANNQARRSPMFVAINK
jgi:NADH:ubiquinone oxidoreductase subunit 6 (subunit J)